MTDTTNATVSAQDAAKMDPRARIGEVHLTITNLDQSLAYYQDRIGLRLHGRDGAVARMGAGGPDLLVLHENPEARRAPRTTGLYHFAILVPTRRDLGLVIEHIATTRTPLQGVADHLVSEALYLGDPDGNGIEIYRDRPRSEWNYDGSTVRMASDPLDFDGILGELEREPGTWDGLPTGTTIGHVHLEVSRIPETQAFYHDVLGFDVMAQWHGALFVSAGGYHHHLGLNTWKGVGLPPAPEEAIGLKYFTVELSSQDEVKRVAERVSAAGHPIEWQGETPVARDPSGHRIMLRAQA
ncbi:MAG TPA: VOC family protein [Ktedonobacterales bacterium]